MSALHEETVRMLDYFWNHKGDLERWCGWDEFKAAHPHHPIVHAWEHHKASEEMLGLLIKGMGS